MDAVLYAALVRRLALVNSHNHPNLLNTLGPRERGLAAARRQEAFVYERWQDVRIRCVTERPPNAALGDGGGGCIEALPWKHNLDELASVVVQREGLAVGDLERG